MMIIVSLSILCILFVCGFFTLLFLLLRRREQSLEKQTIFTNYDRLTGLGNKAKFISDDGLLEDLNSCAIISVHLSRFMELYNLFGVKMSDTVITNFCHSFVQFATEHDGQAYRVAFNHVVLVLHSDDKVSFLNELKLFMKKSELLSIKLGTAFYSYDFLLLYGVYFLSEANDRGTELASILLDLDGKIIHSTMQSAAECVVLDGDDRPDWAMSRALAVDAKSAWESHQFVPYYQPIFNINTGKVVGSEILARWEHPKYGTLNPFQFIPILEANGLVIDLDLYMIEEACQKIQYWLDNGILTVPLAINLSALDIHRADFVERLVTIVTKYDIPPVLLELELPERNLLYEDNESFVAMMNALHKKGFSLSMGHFAETDVSSLWLLRKLPLDIIKVDYHFFDNPKNSERSNLYVQNFLELTKLLNIKVVVTQLETAEKAKVVQEFGCTIGKGFYFSKPLSSEAFEEFIS